LEVFVKEMTESIKQPMDLITLSLGEVVRVRMRGNRELRGRLHAFDAHLNMVLGDTEETTSVVEEDANGAETVVQKTRSLGMVFVRGDTIILVAPPLRTA